MTGMPSEKEREALVAIVGEYHGRGLAELIADTVLEAGFRLSVSPTPSDAGYAEFEDWEQEMFRHEPVLSMQDGRIAGCQCMDRVFVTGQEDWGSHLASIITARLAAASPEPSDAGWSTDDRREALAEGLRRWSVQSQHDRLDQRDHDLYSMGARQGFTLGAEWQKARSAHPEPQVEPSDANAGVGWFEWLKMPENTTEIAYVHENGEVFDPARGWNPVEFTIAAAEGRVHRLVRAVNEKGGGR